MFLSKIFAEGKRNLTRVPRQQSILANLNDLPKFSLSSLSLSKIKSAMWQNYLVGRLS
jgi:hypothetical protein